MKELSKGKDFYNFQLLWVVCSFTHSFTLQFKDVSDIHKVPHQNMIYYQKVWMRFFKMFIRFIDPYQEDYPFMGSFPDIEGLNADGLIKRQICKYIALLFLRQYSLQIYFSYQEPLRPPNISKFKQDALKKWIDYMDYFKSLVKEVYNDKQLLDEVGFGFLNDEWINANQKPHPVQYLADFKQKLEQQFDSVEKTQPITEDTQKQFLECTKNTLVKTFEEYNKLNNAEPLVGEIDKGYSIGGTALLPKSAFADDQPESYSHFDSILARMVSENFRDTVSNSFLFHRTTHYLLSPSDIFSAIDKLDIDNTYVLIAFSVNFAYLIDDIKIDGLTKTSYKDIEIKSFEYGNIHTVGNTIFVIKKEDLPRFEYLDIVKEEKEKYKFTIPLVDEYYLYANIIDLHLSNDLKIEIEKETGEDLSKKVLACIAFRLELQWKKNINCISLGIYSEYINRGIPNKLSDVKPIKKEEN